MERKEGYYWCLPKDEEIWYICYYDKSRDCFHYCCNDNDYYENSFSEIDPTPITRNKN